MQPPPQLAAIQSRGRGAQIAQGLGLIPETEVCPCTEATSSEQVVTASCLEAGGLPAPASPAIYPWLLPCPWEENKSMESERGKAEASVCG